MIEPGHPQLSIRKQCELLQVNRNRLGPRAPKRTASDLEVMREIDEIHTELPFLGARKIRLDLRDRGHRIGRGRVRRLMRLMGISAMVPQPYPSEPSPENPAHPYLLRDMEITRADEVWCPDITYIPMAKGHAYLVAIMDWHTRAVLGARSFSYFRLRPLPSMLTSTPCVSPSSPTHWRLVNWLPLVGVEDVGHTPGRDHRVAEFPR